MLLGTGAAQSYFHSLEINDNLCDDDDDDDSDED